MSPLVGGRLKCMHVDKHPPSLPPSLPPPSTNEGCPSPRCLPWFVCAFLCQEKPRGTRGSIHGNGCSSSLECMHVDSTPPSPAGTMCMQPCKAVVVAQISSVRPAALTRGNHPRQHKLNWPKQSYWLVVSAPPSLLVPPPAPLMHVCLPACLPPSARHLLVPMVSSFQRRHQGGRGEVSRGKDDYDVYAC